MKRSSDLYRALKTMKKSSADTSEQLTNELPSSIQSNPKRTKGKLYRILRTMKRNSLPEPHESANIERDVVETKQNSQQSPFYSYFLRYNKGLGGQRLKNTRQHLTLRLSKRDASSPDGGSEQWKKN